MLQHTTIETHTATAYVNQITGEITDTPAQSPFTIRPVLAKAFNVPLEN